MIRSKIMNENFNYKSAGVDIDAANEAVELIKKEIKKFSWPGVLGEIGGFGGAFLPPFKEYKEPVLIAGTDGVGTKIKIAQNLDRLDTIGIDAVAMCVNDILAQGATPLFFLDYLAVGKLLPKKVAKIVSGVAKGCDEASCALIGGETAEMPGIYQEEDFDLAGFAVGIVEREQILPRNSIKAGDILVGLKSSGLHSNGFSLVRRIIEKKKLNLQETISPFSKSLGDELLAPTRIYVKSILPLLKEDLIKGIAHITGGGFKENIPRILPPGLSAEINFSSWERPYIFKFIQEVGEIEEEEMRLTFNLGIGFVLIIDPLVLEKVRKVFEKQGEEIFLIGKIAEAKGGVIESAQ